VLSFLSANLRLLSVSALSFLALSTPFERQFPNYFSSQWDDQRQFE
jgi:hypothetical protein